MKSNKYLFFLSGMAICLIVLIFIGFTGSKERIAYINNSRVFEEFTLTKELRKDYEKVIEARKKVLDSLRIVILAMEKNLERSDKKEMGQYQAKISLYKTKQNEFSINNREIEARFTDQAVGQINEYIQEYGQEMNYEYILGANGDGSLMYAKEGKNVTDDVIDFINKKYENE